MRRKIKISLTQVNFLFKLLPISIQTFLSYSIQIH